MKIENQRLIAEPGDPFDIRFIQSPNFKPQLVRKQLIIHSTEGSSVAGAIGTFLNGLKSVHLILGKDGKDLVQMVNFNEKAVHAHDYNNTAIGIELDYPGFLTNISGHFTFIGKFKPGEYIYATAENDWKLHPWPLYPRAQLDALLVLSRLLMDQLGIEEVLGHEEINEGKRDPGPAFPMNIFREKLAGAGSVPLVLEETNQEAHLRAGPHPDNYPVLEAGALPKGTPVTIVGEESGWALVEVMAEVNGNPWLIGWLDSDAVQARRFTPVVKDHLLFTSDGRRYKQIKPYIGNYAPNEVIKEHKLVIMHITTGTRMQSTINWFRNPDTQVSSHLLIGRDGRVVQFVPFDRLAFHSGDSHWEGDSNLNRFSIGIELDNAGFLSFSNGHFRRKGVEIDNNDVVMATHWKEFAPRGWQKFTEIQLAVTTDIVKALVEEYGIQEVLGHDVVNLRNRSDPGPLFPMQSFRKEIFGRTEPHVRVFRTAQEADIFDNSSGQKPNLDHPLHKAPLPLLSGVKVLEKQGAWALVKVLSSTLGGLNGAVGWIPAGSIKNNKKMNKTSNELKFFKKINSAEPIVPPTRLKDSPLPTGTRLRILERHDDWTLVATLDPTEKRKWLEGWIMTDLLVEDV